MPQGIYAKNRINLERNIEIITLYGNLTYGQIAKKLKITRCVVAGVIYRYKHNG